MGTLTPEREAEIREAIRYAEADEMAYGADAGRVPWRDADQLRAALDATRAELRETHYAHARGLASLRAEADKAFAELRAANDARARDLALLAEVRAAAQAFHAHEDAGDVWAMLTSYERNSAAYGMAWDVLLRLLRGEG